MLGPRSTRSSRASASALVRAVPYVPSALIYDLLCSGRLHASIEREQRCCQVPGAALFIDVQGFTELALSFVHSDASTASDKLTETLSAYFSLLVGRLHAAGAEVLQYVGDALIAYVPAYPSLEAAVLRAAEAALAVRAIEFVSDGGVRLVAHQSIGAGEMELLLLASGSGSRVQAVFCGELIRQACEAQRAAKGDDILLSGPAAGLLGAALRSSPVEGAPGLRRLHAIADHALAPGPPPSTTLCGCGFPLRGKPPPDEAALQPYAPLVLALAPPSAAGDQGDFLASAMRNAFVIFASFPELDVAAPELAGRPAAAAARLGQVVRSVFRVAEEFGGSVNKLITDEKGTSALVAFGLPGGFAHEDDAERAVRAALALARWFAETDAPLACGVAVGRTFCGTLGAPCRKEYALISDAIILAARLMAAARAASAAGPAQQVLCAAGVQRAVAALERARGRPSEAKFEPRGALRFKGFAEEVEAFAARPRRAALPPSQSMLARGDLGSAAWEDDAARSPVVSPVMSPSGSPRPPAAAGAPPAGSGGLFGREEELGRVLAAVAGFLAGRGATLAFEGEAGLGKSALARQARRACARGGALVLRGEAEAVEAGTALWPLRAVLASAADVRSEAGLRASLARRGLPEADAGLLWRALFEAPAARAATARAASRQDGADEGAADGAESYRGRATGRRPSSAPADGSDPKALSGPGLLSAAAEALARLVRALEGGEGAPCPVCLFLEDGHFCDSATLFVLRYLRDSCPRLLLSITVRPLTRSSPRDLVYLCKAGAAPALPIASEEGWSAPEIGTARGRQAARSPAGAAAPFAPPGALYTPSEASEGEGSTGRLGGRRSSSRANTVPPLPPLSGIAHALSPPALVTPRPPGPAAVHVRLRPLERAAARGLLVAQSRALAVAWSPQAVEAVLDKAQGVPIFILELVRQQAAAAAATARTPAPDAPQPVVLALPDTIQQLVLSRVDGLPPHAQAATRLCAVVEVGVTLAALRAIDPTGTEPAELASALRLLTRQGILRGERRASAASAASPGTEGPPSGEEGEGEAGGALCFAQSVVREAVYASMPGAQRRAVHAAYAAFLEGRRTPPDAAVLARHWREGGEPARALVHAEAAARQALRKYALPEARRLFAEVVQTIDGLRLAGPAAPPLPPRLRDVAGLPPRPDAAPAAFSPPSARPSTRPPAAAARWQRARLRALRAWMFIDYSQGNLDDAKALAELVLEWLGHSMPTRPASLAASAGLLRRLLVSLRRRAAGEGRSRAAANAAEEEAAERLDGAADGFHMVAWVHIKNGAQQGGAADAFLLAAHGLARALELSLASPVEAELHGRLFASTAILLLTLGLRSESERMLRRAEPLAERLPSDWVRTAVSVTTGIAHATRGEFEAARGAFEAGLAAARRASFNGVLDALASLGLVFAMTGSLPECGRASAELLDFAERVGSPQLGALLGGAGLALAAFFAGRDEEMAAALELARPAEAAGVGARWARVVVDVLRGVHGWRARGDAAGMLATARRTLDFWRRESRSSNYTAVIPLWATTDFLLWAEAHARPPPQPRLTSLLPCLRPEREALELGSLRPAGGRKASDAPLNGLPPGPPSAARGWRSGRPPALELPGPEEGAGERRASWCPPGPAVAEAAGLAREAVGLLRASARRVPALAPCCAYAAAAGAGGLRRRRLLREAAAGFAAMPWPAMEACASAALAAELPPGPDAAALAAHARRLAADRGLSIRALGGPISPGGYVSWI